MKFISHRGNWNSNVPQNSRLSFLSSLDKGFGIETDLRDLNGQIVISHDMPRSTESLMTIDDFFELYNSSEIYSQCILALNLKSTGFIKILKQKINQYQIKNYFLFDMPGPEHYYITKLNLIAFTRYSEVETRPIMFDTSEGVWIDSFTDENPSLEHASKFLNENKKVCVVSPELHKRSHQNFWELIKKQKQLTESPNFYLCTDFPELAKKYFYE